VTLSTHVYVLDEIAAEEAFHFCRELLGCTPRISFTNQQELLRYGPDSERIVKPDGYWTICNDAGQGLPAWLLVNYRPGAPFRTQEQAAKHDEWCEPDCDGVYHPVACWLDIDFDTAYSYADEHGGCGDLHARLVARLGLWLDAKGVRWSWRNEFTGDVHGGEDRYDRLGELLQSGAHARTWMETVVMPAIQGHAKEGS
jgi:hypothetical protein